MAAVHSLWTSGSTCADLLITNTKLIPEIRQPICSLFEQRASARRKEERDEMFSICSIDEPIDQS